MKKIIALLLALMLVMVFTLGCQPAEKPADEAPATHEEPAPAEAPATHEAPAPAEEHAAPAESAH